LQSIPSRQLEFARANLAAIANQIAGQKWWRTLPIQSIPTPRLPELGFIWGASSLWRPPKFSDPSTPKPVRRPQRGISEEVLRQLHEVRRKAITQRRACAFVSRILSDPGKRIDSANLAIHDHDTLIDVLSCLCYANAPRINYRVYPMRPRNGSPRFAPAGDWYLERFVLERTR
jgi:hypothetical protein